MGRTRLRGIELAGMRVAVEVPGHAPWAARRGSEGFEAGACPTHEPDIYVGVRIAEPVYPRGESIVYSSRGRTFEVARRGDDWWIAAHGRERNERVLRFDARTSEGEVTVHPRAASHLAHPLAHPLDELLAVHGTARRGGIVLRATTVLREGRALVFAGPGCRAASGSSTASAGGPAVAPGAPTSGDGHAGTRWGSIAAGGNGCVALRFDAAGIEVHDMPRVGSASARAPGDGPMRARLDAIHLIAPSAAVYSQALEVDEAAEELLLHVFAPVHDPESAGRMAESALKLSRAVPVLRLGLPEEDRVVPFTWGRRRAALAFAPPYPS